MSSTFLAGEAPAAGTTPSAEGTAPVLAMPEGWVIDGLSRARLERELASAPEYISGVVAETSPLSSGTSFRVHAERLCLRPYSVARRSSQRAWNGAVLVRPEVSFEIRDGVVEVETQSLLVDPGAHVHDPWRPIGSIEAASPLGRPPFPWRPVVVFLACEPDVEALDWARSLVNNLVRREVEGRLAMLDIAEGLHLTQQCLPTEESIQALDPDVIVALDRSALDAVSAWCPDSRSVVAVEYTPDVATTAELVSWRLGHARGRLRARIGRRIDAPSLVSLVNRLCSGPHPGPPTDTAIPSSAAAVRSMLTRKQAPIPEPTTKRSVVVISQRTHAVVHEVLDGLMDHLVAAGHGARVCDGGGLNSHVAEEADVVLVGFPLGDPENALVEARQRSGRPTVAILEPSEVWVGMNSPHEAFHLASAPARLARSCNGVVTSSSALRAVLRSLNVRTHLLPALLSRERVAELRSARSARGRSSEPVIAWTLGVVGTPLPDYTREVAEAMLTLLAERPELRVEIIGEPESVPVPLRHRRLRTLPARPDAEALTRWTAHVWTPLIHDDNVAADTLPLVESTAAGVPTVLPEPIRTAVGGYPPPGLLVDRFERAASWVDALRLLLDDRATASAQSRAAIRRFDTTHGPATADVVVNRFLGWALYTEEHS